MVEDAWELEEAKADGASEALETFVAELARRVPSLWLEDAMSPKDLAERIAKELGGAREAGAKEN